MRLTPHTIHARNPTPHSCRATAGPPPRRRRRRSSSSNNNKAKATNHHPSPLADGPAIVMARPAAKGIMGLLARSMLVVLALLCLCTGTATATQQST